MCKKLIYLTCLIVLMSAVGNASAELVAHYKLDEIEGTIAADSSGNGYDGTLDGDAQWVAGLIDGALQFNGDDSVTLPGDTMGLTSDVGSVVFWFNYPAIPVVGIKTIWWGGDNTTGTGMGPENEMHVHIEQPVTDIWIGGEICFRLLHGTPMVHLHSDPKKADASAPGDPPVDPILINDGEWHHFAGTWGDADGNVNMYLDGDFVQQAAYAPPSYPLSYMYLGQMAAGNRTYDGILDDVKIYNHALSAEDIHIFVWGPLTLSWKPSPKNNAIEVPKDVILSWSLGSNADKHDVYFGTDANSINQASRDNPLDILLSQNQDANTYDPDGLLDYGQTYYWRIDEVNDAEAESPWKGNVWSFTVLNFIVVDDFESYNDEDRLIYDTWIDGWVNGTGSTVGYQFPPYAEQETVRSGNQSMPLTYMNTSAPFYSEAEQEWPAPQDWTVDDVVTLTLWLYGDPANSADPLYVAVEDSAGKSKVVVHPDTAVMQLSSWQQWDIALSEFSNAGVNLAAVKKMYIGVGNRAAPSIGGMGTLLFDDIRLYRQ